MPLSSTCSIKCDDVDLMNKEGDALTTLASLVLRAGCMCVTPADGTGVTREQVKAFLDMALTLLMPEQIANLKKWQDTRASTVALSTYQQLQWLYLLVMRDWKPLPSTE